MECGDLSPLSMGGGAGPVWNALRAHAKRRQVAALHRKAAPRQMLVAFPNLAGPDLIVILLLVGVSARA